MDPMQPFTDPAAVDRYAGTAASKVPGLADLQRMAAILLAERAPEAARILVLGAGGGAELAVFAAARPGSTFLGVDPSKRMLDLARDRLGPHLDRIRLLEGYIDDAPDGPFDGAACLLTLHFLPRDERLRTLRALHRRMKPGAALVVAHHSLPEGGGGRREDVQAREAGGVAADAWPADDRPALPQDAEALRWLARSATFAGFPAADPTRAATAAATMARLLPLLPAAEDAALIAEAGFADVALFYAGFTFRGWVGVA